MSVDNAAGWVTHVTLGYGDDGLPDYRIVTRTTVDAAGREIRVERTEDGYQYDDGVDGRIDSRAITLSDYDDSGNLTRRVSRFDIDDDGNAEETTQTFNEFDASGRMVEHLIVYMAGGGYVLKRELTRWEYNADGEIVRESVREDGGLIEPMLTVTRTSYDTTGHISATETTKDWGLDGVIDERLSTQFTYDSAGQLISEQTRQDWDGDGVIDERKTVLYDANGNETRSATSSDWNGDGVIDSRELVRSTYDAAGNLTRRVDTDDRDGDGDIDSREITTTTYDAAGNPTRSAVTIDDFADGVINSRTVSQTQYDKDGRPIVATFRRDWDGDGTFDENSTTRYTYDEAGRLVRQVDTLPEELYRSVHRFAYDEAGRLILDAVSAVDSRRDFTQIFRTEYNDAGQVVFQEFIRRQDFISDAFRSVTRTTYDEAGRKIKEVYLTDWDMDGTIDSKTVSQHHYTPDDFVPATLAGDALLA